MLMRLSSGRLRITFRGRPGLNAGAAGDTNREPAQRRALEVLPTRKVGARPAAAQVHEEPRGLVPGQLAVELEGDRALRLGAAERRPVRIDEMERHIP
jgi:hypothetical protein